MEIILNYTEALNFIHSRKRFGGIDSMRVICSLLGNPQKGLKFIHIAGTNGKGSVSAYIANCLKTAGYKAGAFISPFVYDFRERIQINGEHISEDDLCRLTEKIAKLKQDVAEFELVTAIGFCLFAEQKCDFVVLETGLGGRFDQTNVIDCPEVTCLTLIDMDHTQILGDTIEKIAYEKSGIIKGGTVVSYPIQHKAALEVIKKTCEDTNSILCVADVPEIIKMTIDGTEFMYKGERYGISMLGAHQPNNAAVAIEALKALEIDDIFIKEGLKSTRFAGRFEVIHKNPYIVIDGCHNESGMRSAAQAVRTYFGKVNMVLGMAGDKDWEKCIEIIAPCVNKMVLTKPDTVRAWNLQEAEAAAKKFCANVVCREKIADAVSEAVGDLPVLIGGSLYLIGKASECVGICL